MDEHNNRIFLKQAILDGMSQKYEEEMALNEENADCSKQHYVKMRRLLNLHGTNVINTKFNKRALIAILIAVALLLAGCAVYVYREVISDFIVEIYEDHIKIFHEEQKNAQQIEQIYEAHYIPEGYELKSEILNLGKVYYIWKNTEDDKIIFDQRALSGSDFFLNGEQASTLILEHNQIQIYCTRTDNSCYYVWSDGTYALSLKASIELDQSEIIQIIDNLKLK